MNINKDNYEEYFLLFADNELSDQEKNMVEAFVRQHADLEEEFLDIKQSVFKPENDLKLEDKSSLFRHTKFISHANYEKVFVLYNDNELTSLERSETEDFLFENPSLKNEFELLQKTKLQPDNTIVFPNKKLLFKREGSGKVVPFKWWKAAAAAVLLGAGIWIGIDFRKENKNEVPITIKNNISKKQSKITLIPSDTANIGQLNVVVEKKSTKHPLKQKSLLPNNNDKPVKARNVNEYQALKTQKQTNNLPDVNNMDNKIEKEEPNVIAKDVQKNNSDNLVKENNDTGNTDNKEVKQDEIVNTGKNAVPDVLTTSYTSNESENSNNYAFYNIKEEKFNKSKVGSFLHKVIRIVERKISPLNNSKNQREVAVN